DKGIMITSNIELLNKSFEKTDEVIQLSEVKYIDHERDFIPTGNLNDCIIHKNKAYYYEEEIRLIYSLLGTGKVGNGLVYDWDSEPIKTGKYIKVNLDTLIDEIVLSPYASTWFYDIIQDLLQKYNLDKKIR